MLVESKGQPWGSRRIILSETTLILFVRDIGGVWDTRDSAQEFLWAILRGFVILGIQLGSPRYKAYTLTGLRETVLGKRKQGNRDYTVLPHI